MQMFGKLVYYYALPQPRRCDGVHFQQHVKTYRFLKNYNLVRYFIKKLENQTSKTIKN